MSERLNTTFEAEWSVHCYEIQLPQRVKSSPFDLVPGESVVGGRADENTAKADVGARTSAMPLTTDQIDGEPFSLLSASNGPMSPAPGESVDYS